MVTFAVAGGPPAQAAVMEVDGATVILRVGAYETSPTDVRRYDYGPRFSQPPSYQVRGSVTAGPGCRQFTEQVWCDDLGITAFSAQLGEQSDDLKVMASTQDVSVAFPVPVSMFGAGGDDVLEGSAAAPNQLDGGAGMDSLTGGSSADRLDLGPDGGANAIGGAGDDVITGSGNLLGGTGNDVLQAGAGPSAQDGGDGDDVLTGGPARDTLDGGDGADRINGGSGDDIITDRNDHVAADCDVPPAFRLRRAGWRGLTVHATLSGFSEPVDVRVDAVRCLPLGFPGGCLRGEKPRSFAHPAFKAKPGVERKVKLMIPRSALPHLRRSPGSRSNRDVWLWVRARNARGITASRASRLKVIP